MDPKNGSAGDPGEAPEPPGPSRDRPAPALLVDSANACVQFVKRAVGVTLDFTPETLSVLDHYLTTAAAEARGKPQALELLAQTAAAYLGEVIRRRFEAWWHGPGDDLSTFHLRFEHVYLMLSPYELTAIALGMPGREEGFEAGFVIEEAELEELGQHLARLPEVSEEEFRLLTTRYDVLEIVLDQLKARADAGGLGEVSFNDADYEG